MTRDLAPFFRPRSVAVVGASERVTSSGGAVLQMLTRGGFPGDILPINPKGGTAFDLPVLTSLDELKAPADLCVIVIRPDLILDAVEEAGRTGHKHVLILPGGFQEAGEDGKARDRALRDLARRFGMTIAGPNCAGIIHEGPAGRMGATFLRAFPPGGGLALISQSGALAEEAIAFANDHGLAIGTVVSVGNATHLGVAEYLDYLGGLEEVSALLIYAESIADRDRFRDIARHVAADKPVIMLMGGHSAPGQAAAAADCCAVRVTSLRRMLLAAKGFGAFPQGIGKRTLVLSNSGGPGVLCTDRAALEGLELVPLPQAMAKELKAHLPPEASVANPIDLLADAREDRFHTAFEAALGPGAGGFDAILGIHVVPFMVDADPVIRTLAALAGTSQVPVFHAMMGTLEKKADWFAAMEEAGVPMFNDVEAMAECAGLLARYPPLKQRASGEIQPPSPATR
jgi:acetyltransferase